MIPVPAAPVKWLIGGLTVGYALAMVWIASSVLYSLNMKSVIMYWTVLALALGAVLSALPLQRPRLSALCMGALLPIVMAAAIWVLAQFAAEARDSGGMRGGEIFWALQMVAVAMALCASMTLAGTVAGQMLRARLQLPDRAVLVAGLAATAITLGLVALRYPEI